MTGNESGELCKPFPSFPGLCIKARLSAQPLIWRWFFIIMQIKLIFTRKVVHFFSLKVSVFGTRKWPNFSPFFSILGPLCISSLAFVLLSEVYLLVRRGFSFVFFLLF